MTAAIRVAVESSTYSFNCMFCGGISGVGSHIGGSDIGWVLMVVVVMVRYWWSRKGDVGDVDQLQHHLHHHLHHTSYT